MIKVDDNYGLMVALVSTISYSTIKIASKYLAAKINGSKISKFRNVILKILNGNDLYFERKRQKLKV